MLAANGLNLGYNKLESSQKSISSFLTSHDPDWATTQTVPPADVQVANVAADSVDLTWTPIAYRGDGGSYQVLYGSSAGGPYDQSGCTTWARPPPAARSAA